MKIEMSTTHFCLFLALMFVWTSATLAIVKFPWMYYLPYGETVTLKPLFENETEAANLTIKSCRWRTPRGIDLMPDIINFDSERYILDKQSCELTIINNQRDTNGVYHCIINEFYISKAMLNVHGKQEIQYVNFSCKYNLGLILKTSYL